MAVYAVRCKGCRILLPTGVRTGWVRRPILGPRTFACPACGAFAVYHGPDFAPLGAEA